MSGATLAARLGKDPAQISRLLGAPGNWTIDTVAELLFAVDGSLLTAGSICAAEEPLANQRFATCFEEESTDLHVFYISTTSSKKKESTHSETASMSWQ
ncbi:hypothetical protein QO004_000444 [Rhizobium mesoamericanum]|uniref:hypothetical protein n=1 Tax=Rhizobium mesoamericanum TaxID=1079800 RepID=UPI0027821F88|nr:hypothetical protein [Rhizobium mesoamericanum]MDQ0558669.1 hypothetical protein [Rhizobium mesoamericanum]